MSGFWEVGKKVFIRGVTNYYIGEIAGFDRDDKEIILKKASWIADTGRFADAMKSGNLGEVEPYPDDRAVLINREAIMDACEWPFDLPDKQK